jgi:hypothetical protein
MKLLKSSLNYFWKLRKPAVLRNLKFKEMHNGETCLIFGNGGSLKYYDFSALPNLPAIGCSYSLVDKRLTDVDMRYWVVSDPYSLYPIIRNSYFNSFQRNNRLPIFKKIILANKEKILFTSLTNFYSFVANMDNVNYFHHFGDKSSLSYDLSGNFCTCSGALDIMIGVARYLGFSKAILLGCDYLGSPKFEGHFYGDKIPVIGKDTPEEYFYRIRQVAGDLNILAIFPKGVRSPVFKSASFEEYFGCPEVYRDNHEIIDKEYLNMMRKAAPLRQIWM